MKLLFCSDLHIDANERFAGIDITPYVIQAFKNHSPDAVIIAGDISGNAERTLDYIRIIEKEVGVPVYVVPGNHDIWTREHGKDASWSSYQLLLQDQSSLLSNTLIHGQTAVIGAMSWYDYTFGPSHINKVDFGYNKKRFWNDAKFAKWDKKDEELCDEMLQLLEEKLKIHQNKEIILVNHYIPYYDFVTVKNEYSWDFCNAFMGSERLGKLIDQYDNIKTVVFGHTHRRYGVIEDFGGKTIICKPLGYAGEWDSDDIESELEKVITEIHI